MLSFFDGGFAPHNKLLSLSHGSVRRLKRSEMYGAMYVSLYGKRIEQTFRLGERVKGRKLDPARMLESVVSLYRLRYNLPDENEICGLITRLMKRRRQNVPEEYPENIGESEHARQQLSSELTDKTTEKLQLQPPSATKKYKRMRPEHAQYLASLVNEIPGIMLNKALTSQTQYIDYTQIFCIQHKCTILQVHVGNVGGRIVYSMV
ncbi:hypothetical protein PHMEG_0003981 [Phytophthora megakarya]|uniref:Uncharacterized protein n=1 Tax=Phytophthora megakarya TaxID=4795 RepID=A0A225WV40_9STRA|nr:hypothetical protein PHMEG_0003981 [Phytophthora megakarya]